MYLLVRSISNQRVVSLATACKHGQSGLCYYIIEPPKSTETRPTGDLGSIEYIVNSWIAYHNNYSADYLKCQRPARMILNRLPPLTLNAKNTF